MDVVIGNRQMDEQRMAAYVELIQQLFECEHGQEAEVLQVNAGLVDAGLLEAMGQYAEILESQENNNAAGWLKKFAGQLVEALGMARKNQMGTTPRNSEEFLVEILQLIARTQDRIQVHQFLQANLERLNEDLLSILPEVFEKSIQQNNAVFIATTFMNFGNSVNQLHVGNRLLNLELSIASYQLALRVRTRDASPEDWAMTQNNLATAYHARIRGDRADNIELAIESYKIALEVYTRSAFPEQWVTTQNNLASTYSNRIRGDRADNIELAIKLCKMTLEVYTRSENWATTQHNLADAYHARIRGDRADNIELAIESYKMALEVRTQEAFPADWAATRSNLANAYSSRIREHRADNIELAIDSHKMALEVYTQSTFPDDWAGVQHNLANTYLKRIQGERADNIERSIEFCEMALEVYTQATFPENWAMTQGSLANAYKARILGERADNIERSIKFCEIALEVYTQATFPESWATTQNNLAIAYSDRVRGERADNIEYAIIFYQLALKVRTQETFPEDWAMTQNNLALAYHARIRGERADNIEYAIASYQLALEVRTRTAFPEDWATTQNNLAIAYANRIRGIRENNIELAVEYYHLALEVRTRTAFPEDWATTQNNLANAYSNQIRGNRENNIELAIESYKMALEVYTQEAFPKECRLTSRSLGNLHFQRQNWPAATRSYANALAAAETLYQSCIFLDGKAAELSETANIAQPMTYVLARTGKLPQALETLEKSRARGLTESLNRDGSNLDQLQTQNLDLYQQYKTLTEQLRNLEAQQRDRATSSDRHSITPENLRNTAIELRKQLSGAIEQIRRIPGYEKFLESLTFEEIQSSVTSDRPFIYLVTTSEGSLALILRVDTIEAIWINEFNDQQLNTLLNQTWFAAYNNSQTDHQTWLNAIDTTTRQLWEPLMAPIIEKLNLMGYDRATLIPTGFLSLFPLHAAWTEDLSKPTGHHYAIDDIHFTYAPNAKSLTAAQTIAQTIQPTNILAIDNPTQNLPNSEREINAAIETFQNPIVLRHSKATIEAVKKELAKAAIVHFSCHGTANLNEPLNSGLLMSDGLLTLRDILALNLAEKGGIRLAILSACETGLNGIDAIDEAISLPTGLLQAGVAAVIASFWSVNELSTMILLIRFYDFWRKDDLEPSIALHQAQLWVRDTTSQEKANYFKPNHPALFQKLILLPADYFAHPFHWSAFSYTGV